MKYNRDERLNSLVEVDIQSAESHLFEYVDFREGEEPLKKLMARINKTTSKNPCYSVIKMVNTGKIDIHLFVEECELFVNMGVLPLLGEWLQVEDSVFPASSKLSRPVFCVCVMPKIVVHLEDRSCPSLSLKTVGDVVVEVTRCAGESEHFLREGYLYNRVKASYIESLKEFMKVKVNIGF